MLQTQRREEKKWQGKNIVNVGWREGIREERRKRRKLAEAQLCAANVVQAWLIQQRLLWRPTMRLWGAQTAETRRERREEGAGNKRGGGYCQQKKKIYISKTIWPWFQFECCSVHKFLSLVLKLMPGNGPLPARQQDDLLTNMETDTCWCSALNQITCCSRLWNFGKMSVDSQLSRKPFGQSSKLSLCKDI